MDKINKKQLSHVDSDGRMVMVDIGDKVTTDRRAVAECLVFLGSEIMKAIDHGEILTKKGSVFQTAQISGIMAAKRTSDLIPLCHPLSINKIDVDISIYDDEHVLVTCTVSVQGKTGVEMEALTGVSVAALTIYDMCKAMSHEIEIVRTRLLTKTGGKSDFNADK